MFINREYSLEYFQEDIFSEKYILVISNIDDRRSQALLKNFSNVRYINIDYNVQKSSNGILVDSFKTKTNFNSPLNNKEFSSLYQDLNEFVNLIHEESQHVIIDISAIHLRFLGAFLANLDSYKWESIICTYTESSAYPRTNENNPIDTEKHRCVSGFDLNSSFLGFDEIPNLKTITRERENYIWVAFLGFEGKRSAAVYTEISDDSSLTIPVITMPSVKSGWANYAFDANQRLFENARLSCNDIQYVDALNPFSTYNFIEKIASTHNNRHLVISPLGTRPVSLGVLLYALKNETCEIYFDTPKDSCSKIVDCGKIHVYDILSFYE